MLFLSCTTKNLVWSSGLEVGMLKGKLSDTYIPSQVGMDLIKIHYILTLNIVNLFFMFPGPAYSRCDDQIKKICSDLILARHTGAGNGNTFQWCLMCRIQFLKSKIFIFIYSLEFTTGRSYLNHTAFFVFINKNAKAYFPMIMLSDFFEA